MLSMHAMAVIALKGPFPAASLPLAPVRKICTSCPPAEEAHCCQIIIWSTIWHHAVHHDEADECKHCAEVNGSAAAAAAALTYAQTQKECYSM